MFIETERLAPFKARGVDVDVVLDLMIHDLDLVVALARSQVKRVSASGFRVLTRDIDIATADIEFASGCVANLSASRVSQAAVRKLRMFQQRRLSVGRPAVGRGALRHPERGRSAAGGGELRRRRCARRAGEEFRRCNIQEKHKAAVGGEDGRRALKLALDVARLVRERLRRFK